MKEFRKIDDNIMLKMNTTDTHSNAACSDFFKKLTDAYQKREHVIDKCLKVYDIIYIYTVYTFFFVSLELIN
jgi:hypothetical protein